MRRSSTWDASTSYGPATQAGTGPDAASSTSNSGPPNESSPGTVSPPIMMPLEPPRSTSRVTGTDSSTIRSARPPAGTRRTVPAGIVDGSARSVPSRAIKLRVCVQHHAARSLVGVRQSQPGRPDLRNAEHVVSSDERLAADGVDERCHVGDVERFSGQHDERAVQAADDALEGVLMRVIPVRSHLVGDEAVDERLARRDGVLRDARDAVVACRHVVAVPVERHAVLDVAIGQGDLDQLALGDDERGPGYRPERHGVVVGAVGQGDGLMARLEVEGVDGTVEVGLAQVRDRDRLPRRRLGGGRQMMAAARGRRDGGPEDREQREQGDRQHGEPGGRSDDPPRAAARREEGDGRTRQPDQRDGEDGLPGHLRSDEQERDGRDDRAECRRDQHTEEDRRRRIVAAARGSPP